MLVSGTPRAGGTGGPGSWPVEAQPQQGEGWRFQLKNQQNSIELFLSSDELEDDDSEDGDRYGARVHIAILDTMPTKVTMRKANQEWHWHHRVVNNINDLLPNNQPRIKRAKFENLHDTVDHKIIGHPYLMRDHGLFVASIIHTLAPKAALHLYEVLNPYGVGSLESILDGLDRILNDITTNKIELPLIVNCSFTLIPPPESTDDYNFWISIVGRIEKRLNLDNVIIVAAAGNDAKYNNPLPCRRPNAHYPAAFKNVVGVGALPKRFRRTRNGRFKAASYSNLSYSNSADGSPTDGYMTLGGEAGPKNGVLGMYISDYFPEPAGFLWRLWSILTLGSARYGKCYPPKFLWDFVRVKYKPNTTGWAWWAGTSFAAAIFSGSLAALYDSENHPFNVQSIMEGFLQPEKSVDDENVLLIEQR
jgi:subtilisin family serine protease